MDIQSYLSKGIEQLIRDMLRTMLKRPKGYAFLLSYARHAKKAAKRRDTLSLRGEHIPPFLIMSVTDDCNLRCAGCYAQCNAAKKKEPLTAAEWARLFGEAQDLGICIILLAGGEPFMQRDVLISAAAQKRILFPIFTNGTLWDEAYARLFRKKRNLIPMISLEGDQTQTDARRGGGVYDQVWALMTTLSKMALLFGTSIMVTSENMSTVTGDAWIEKLWAIGCRIVLYVEYVPIECRSLMLNEADRSALEERLNYLRAQFPGLIFISFPGDEHALGGCLAAGRGFFHINATGGVEPCPFSPYSDTNIRDISLREAIKSPLFTRLRESDMLNGDHSGGCALFEKKELVEQLSIDIGGESSENQYN